MVTLQSSKKDTPNFGDFYVYLADEGETPNAATVAANGFFFSKNSIQSIEAGAQQSVWVLSDSGTITIRFAERG